MRRAGRLAGVVAAVAVMAGCGSDSGGPGGDTGAISIGLSQTGLEIQQGGSGSLTATITRTGGFTGTVNVTTEGAPAGVTATVSNVTTTNGTTTGTITVAVGPSVTPQVYTLTVRASGNGVATVSQTFSLTVTPLPAITIAVNPTTLSLVQGATGTVAVTIGRTNFTNAVNLTLEGAPVGVTGTFAPPAPTGISSTLTVTVGGAVSPGTFTLTVRAAAAGVSDVTTTFSLTVGTPGSFTIGPVSPNPVTIVQGNNANLAVAISRTDFTGTINLTLEGAPAGVTGAFTPAAVAGTASTLNLAVGAAVAPANYTLTVRGTALGQADRTATFTLTVTPAGSYTMTFTPAGPVEIRQGNNGSVTLNVNRTGGFTGNVTLTAGAVPAGVGVTFGTNPVTGASSSVNITVGSGVAIGPFDLTVTGAATGLSGREATIRINVSAAAGSGNTTLDYSACTATTKPVWLAFQDGSGALWTPVTGSNGVFNFDLHQTKIGVATVLQSGTDYTLAVNYWTVAEVGALTTAQLCTASATKSLTVTAQNLGLTQQAFFSLGGGFGAASSAQPTATLSGVASGTFDLLGYARDPLAVSPDRGYLRRDVNTGALAGGASAGTADFQGSDSFTPSFATMTLNGTVGGESIFHQMFYHTGAACTTGILYSGASGLGAYGVPAARQRATDYHGLSLIATLGNASSGTTRTVTDYFQAFAQRTNTLPSVIPAQTPASVPGPYKRLQFQFTLPADLNGAVTAQYLETGPGSHVALMSATAGWLGGLAVVLTLPDFTGLAGWQNSYAPSSGAVGTWTVAAGGGTGTPCTGGKLVASTRSGSF